jgi:hypothetical protein
MNRIALSPLLLVLVSLTAVSQQAPRWDWARGAGGTYFANSICTDDQGFVYMTGSFSDSIIFGSNTLHTVGSAAGNVHQSDIYIVKYDSLGQVIWARSAGSAGYDHAVCIKSGPRGDIFLSGYICDSLAYFGNITVNTGAPSGQNYRNLFVARYDKFGNTHWATCAVGTDDNEPAAMCVDRAGNVYLTGNISGALTFGSSTLLQSGAHAFLVKLSPAGQPLWATSAGSNVNDGGATVAISDSGDVFLAGNFYGALAFAGTQTLNALAGDLFVARFSTNGVASWLKKIGGAYNDWVSAMVCDPAGNVLLAGAFTSPAVSFDCSTFARRSVGDIFVTKLHRNGQCLWASSYGGGCSQDVAGMAVDGVGDIYITGSYSNPQLTFGAFTFTHEPGPVGSKMFLVKIKNTGVVAWARNAASHDENDQAQAVAVDLFGNVYASGTYYSSWMAFDSDSLFTQAGASGGPDIYLSRIGDNVVDYPVIVRASLDALSKEKCFSVYPNPSAQVFTITLSEEGADCIRVMDLNGGVVWQCGAVVQKDIPVELPGVPASAYVLVVQRAGVMSTRRLLLK